MHLSPEELTDYAEGARDPADAPHLQSCDICRHQVASLRKTMSVLVGASSMNVPDPSPLFWDHLSQRVHEAVAAEQARDERRATGLGRLVGLAKASSDAIDTPAVIERFKTIGVVVAAKDRRSPEYLTNFVKSELARWVEPIKASGVMLD